MQRRLNRFMEDLRGITPPRLILRTLVFKIFRTLFLQIKPHRVNKFTSTPSVLKNFEKCLTPFIVSQPIYCSNRFLQLQNKAPVSSFKVKPSPLLESFLYRWKCYDI